MTREEWRSSGTYQNNLTAYLDALLKKILAILPIEQDEYVLMLATMQGDAVAKAALAVAKAEGSL